MIPPLPCPACHSINLSITRTDSTWSVACLYCDILSGHAPHYHGATLPAALARWNKAAAVARLHAAGAHYVPYDGWSNGEQRRGWYLGAMWLGYAAVEAVNQLQNKDKIR